MCTHVCECVRIRLHHYFEMSETKKLYLIRDLLLPQEISTLNLSRNEKATVFNCTFLNACKNDLKHFSPPVRQCSQESEKDHFERFDVTISRIKPDI